MSYSITDLGALGSGTYSVATAINNAGQVVGYSGVNPENFLYHAFRYDGHAVRDIGALAPNGNEAYGINDSGTVVGDYVFSPEKLPHAFATAPNSDLNPATDDLGTLGGSYSRAFGINTSGQVAGESYLDVSSHAFLYSGGVMRDLGSLGGPNSQSLARAINDGGLVVGRSFVPNGNAHAFLYDGTGMTDLGTLGGPDSEAHAINARGWVVGFATTASIETHAFLYNGTEMNDLGTLGGKQSIANGINRLGQVVGESLTTTSARHAFLYDGGPMIDLNDLLPANSGWQLDVATGINDSGQIAGYGHNQRGDGHAFLLTPATPPSFVVTNALDSGTGSFRQGILDADATPGPHTIRFAIGTGVQTINLASPLPTITQPVVIDGTTQPGYTGAPLIELNGAGAGPGADGLLITAGGSVVRGLVINRFSLNGMELQTNGGNIIQDNYIGTDLSGTASRANGKGISVSAPSNSIGGTTAGLGNVISGNEDGGIFISGSGNIVQGNYIGTDATGTTALPNDDDGVGIAGGSNNTIGGTVSGAGNVIAGNRYGDGVFISNGGTGNLIQGNYIGTDVTGTLVLGNANNGVRLLSASGNTIGGTAAGAGNVIAFNGNDGVLVDGGTANPIRQNSIFGHTTGLGIELVNGGNNRLPFPVLTSASSDGNTTTVAGLLQSTPDTDFTLEFFANPVCNPSGFGEGQQFLGLITVTTSDHGTASFTVTFAVAVTPGQFVAATATHPSNNSSAFSNCATVFGPPVPPALVPGTYRTGIDEAVVLEPITSVKTPPKAGALGIPTIPERIHQPLRRGAVDVLFGKGHRMELMSADAIPEGFRDGLWGVGDCRAQF